MDPILATVTAAGGLFAGTNIDDMVVLAALNVSSRADGRPRRWEIWAGQSLGVAALVALARLAALGLTLVPSRWIWLLGLVPLGLGARKLVQTIRATRAGKRQESLAVARGLLGVLGVTVANGGDNIAAYTPVFRTTSPGDLSVTLVVFTLGVALWCALGTWCAAHRALIRIVRHWGQWLVPAVYILIGLYIFYKGGALGW
jgi:cadmium resistance protein CadD (predicted permease)